MEEVEKQEEILEEIAESVEEVLEKKESEETEWKLIKSHVQEMQAKLSAELAEVRAKLTELEAAKEPVQEVVASIPEIPKAERESGADRARKSLLQKIWNG